MPTAVACPHGTVSVRLSLASRPAAGGGWDVVLTGTATNASSGALLLESLVADVRSGGAVVGAVPADVAQPSLAPGGSTSVHGTGHVSATAAPTVGFGSAKAVWTSPGTGSCPVPH